jgi:hypothetical protein
MRQATTAKVCLDLTKSARFAVPVQSTAGLDRLLLTLSTIAIAQADPSPKTAEIWRTSPSSEP